MPRHKAASLNLRKKAMHYFDRDQEADAQEGEFRLLKNPLPGPPRKDHIRMEFDLADPEEDEFDLEISGDDDFDI